MTDTETTLLDAIEQFPDDDGLRGAYADELDYDGYSPRAELIRVQIAIESAKSIRQLKNEFFRKEEDLLREYEFEFRRGPKCERCHGKGWKFVKDDWRPGMMIRQPGDECQVCHGTGYLGGLMRKEQHTGYLDPNKICWRHKVEFVRGFPRVYCRMEECVSPTYRSDKPERYKPSDWLLSVVRHHRGVEVWVTDVPFMAPGRFEFRLRRNGGILPQAVEDLIYGHDTSSAESAKVALARAFPAWARGYLK